MPTLYSEDGPSPRTFEMTPFPKQCLRKRKAITLHIHRYHFESCNSTNEAAHDWLKTALPGNVGIFTTTHQIEGKGQRGTTWDQKRGKDLAWSIAFHWEPETSNQIRKHCRRGNPKWHDMKSCRCFPRCQLQNLCQLHATMQYILLYVIEPNLFQAFGMSSTTKV